MTEHDHQHHQGESSDVKIDSLRGTALVRRPGRSGEPWERRLAAANDRAAAHSLAVLDGLVPSVAELLRHGHGTPARPVAVADLFEHLDPSDLLDVEFVHNDLPPSRVRATGGASADDHDTDTGLNLSSLGYGFTAADQGSVARLLAAGGEITVLCVEEQHVLLRAHLEHWDRAIGASARADLVAVGRGGRRSWQRDDAARLVIPIDGQGVISFDDHAAVPLGPGLGAYVPPGNDHRIESSDGHLIALVLVLPRSTVHHASGLAAIEAVYWPILRSDVPHDRRPDRTTSFAGSVFDRVDGFAEAIDRAVDDRAMDRTIARALAFLPGRYHARLSDSLRLFVSEDPDGAGIRCPLPGGIQVLEVADPPPGVCTLAAGGKEIQMPTSCADLLIAVADGRSHRIADLREAHPDSPVDDLLRALVAASLAEVT